MTHPTESALIRARIKLEQENLELGYRERLKAARGADGRVPMAELILAIDDYLIGSQRLKVRLTELDVQEMEQVAK